MREAQSCGSYPSDDDAMSQLHDRPWPLKFGRTGIGPERLEGRGDDGWERRKRKHTRGRGTS